MLINLVEGYNLARRTFASSHKASYVWIRCLQVYIRGFIISLCRQAVSVESGSLVPYALYPHFGSTGYCCYCWHYLGCSAVGVRLTLPISLRFFTEGVLSRLGRSFLRPCFMILLQNVQSSEIMGEGREGKVSGGYKLFIGWRTVMTVHRRYKLMIYCNVHFDYVQMSDALRRALEMVI